jgi:hypothetical protein
MPRPRIAGSAGRRRDDAPPLSSSKRDDPAYARYFKLKPIGVPIAALRLKMIDEGLDPDVLEEEA